LGDGDYQEYFVPDSIKGDQRIFARFITQFSTATSFFRFFNDPSGLPAPKP